MRTVVTYSHIELPVLAWGLDSIRSFIPWAKEHGRRAFIVSDLIYDDFGYHSRVSQLLKTAGIDSIIFSDISYKNDYEDIIRMVEVYRASRSDILVGLGGSNALTIASIIASSCGKEERLSLMMRNKPDTPGRPCAKIPVAFRVPYLFSDRVFLRTGDASACFVNLADSPSIVIADSYFLQSMPHKTAASMMISIVADCVSAILEPELSAFYRAFAMESLRIAGKICEKSIITDSENELESLRSFQLDAGILSSLALSSYYPVVSVLSSALYSVAGISRSWANSVFFSNFILNVSDSSFSALGAACEALGLIGLDEDIAASELSRFVISLVERAGFAIRLRDFGISREQLEAAVVLASSTGCDQSLLTDIAARSW
ncbi:iron-containing alcohol dehydrogenase [Spirochaetia bacterium 38H-sp]|uniref:Iron-containing alcohol dehydrogenase n=1 Tax=Rarispira pelagica TaxID=3141764 RepID=A0ABU9U9D0_9SPIR